MIKKAYDIAQNNLRSCYSKNGILAGLQHFDDYWARDSFFASLGALCLKDFTIIRKNLELFIKYQNNAGQIPIRVGDYFIISKILRIKFKQKTRARYTQDKMFSYPTDQNSLFIISFYNYIQKTHDYTFLEKHSTKLKKAIQWNLLCDIDKDYLMEEKNYATWADSIKKSGKVLYTNVLHCEALRAFSELCKIANKKNDSKYYLYLHKKVKQKINDIFWKKDYYLDWIDKKEYDYFSTDGNILAILFNISTKKQSLKIQRCIKKFKINQPVPSKTNYPLYPLTKVSLINHLGGMGDYHNGLSWLWLGCLDAVAKNKIGMKKEAKQLITKISEIITRHSGVYEVYEQNGKPVNRSLYKSEYPFAWSSGMFVYAVHNLNLR